MTELEDLLARSFAAEPDPGSISLATLLGIAHRRRTRRRLIAGGLPIVVIAALVVGLVVTVRGPARATLTPVTPATRSVLPAYPPYVLGLLDGVATLRSSVDGRVISTLSGSGVTAIAAEPDGHFLIARRDASGCGGEFFDVTPGATPVLVTKGLTKGRVDAIAVARDGSLAYAMSTRRDASGCDEDELVIRHDDTERVYHGADRQPPNQSPPANEFILRLAWSPDGKQLALSSGECCSYTRAPKVLDLAGDTYPVDGGVQPPCSSADAGAAFDDRGRLLLLETCQDGPPRTQLGSLPQGLMLPLPTGTTGDVVTDATGQHVLIGAFRLDGSRLVRLAPDGTQLVW